jgi:heme/copper-type cytochrome/quinol oxidase subunit 2
VAGGYISASSEEQKDEAMDPQAVACSSIQTTFVIEVQIVDQAYNRSEPVLVTFNCPASKDHISPSLIIGLVIGLALLGLVIWLLVRFMLHYRRSRQAKSGPTLII